MIAGQDWLWGVPQEEFGDSSHVVGSVESSHLEDSVDSSRLEDSVVVDTSYDIVQVVISKDFRNQKRKRKEK